MKSILNDVKIVPIMTDLTMFRNKPRATSFV